MVFFMGRAFYQGILDAAVQQFARSLLQHLRMISTTTVRTVQSLAHFCLADKWCTIERVPKNDCVLTVSCSDPTSCSSLFEPGAYWEQSILVRPDVSKTLVRLQCTVVGLGLKEKHDSGRYRFHILTVHGACGTNEYASNMTVATEAHADLSVRDYKALYMAPEARPFVVAKSNSLDKILTEFRNALNDGTTDVSQELRKWMNGLSIHIQKAAESGIYLGADKAAGPY